MKKIRATQLLAVFLAFFIFTQSIATKRSLADDKKDSPAKDQPVVLEEGQVVLKTSDKYSADFDVSKADFVLFELTSDSDDSKIEATIVFEEKGKPKKLTSSINTNTNIFFLDKADLQKAAGSEKGKAKLEFTVKTLKKSKEQVHILFITRSLEKIQLPPKVAVLLPVTADYTFKVHYDTQAIKSLTDANKYGIDLSVVSKFSPIVAKLSLKDASDASKVQLFIAGDAWTNNIHVPIAKINEMKEPEILANIEYAATESRAGTGSIKHVGLYWSRVQLGANTFKIGSAPMTGSGLENTFVYYYMTRKSHEKTMITLTVDQGESDLYISNNVDLFPDTNTYTLKSASFKDDEIFIPANQNPDAPKEETWIIGVYNRVNSRYTLRVEHNVKFDFVPAEEGEVIKRSVPAGGQIYVLVDIIQLVQQQDYSVGYYGDKGDVIIKANYFNEEELSIGDLQQRLKDASELARNTIPDRLQRKSLGPAPTTPGNQLLVVLKNGHRTKQEITAFVVSTAANSMIRIPAGNSLKDNLNTDTTQKYSFIFNQNILDTKLMLALEQGSVEIKITDQENIENDKNPLTQKYVASGTTLFKELLLTRTKEFLKDAGFFTKLFVHVTCKKSAYFTIGTSKQEALYHKVKPGVSTIVSYKTDHKNAYFVSMDDLPEKVDSLEIRFERIAYSYFGVKTDSSAKSDYEEELIKNMQFQYVNAERFGKTVENGNTGVAATITDAVEVKHEDRAYYSYKIAPASGYLMIVPTLRDRSPPNGYEIKVVMQVIVNNFIPISANTAFSSAIIPSQQHTYQINLKANSKINIKVSLCTGGDITASLVDPLTKTVIVTNPKDPFSFLPVLDVITLNQTTKYSKSSKEITYGPVGDDTFIFLRVNALKNSSEITAYNIISEETKIDDFTSIRHWMTSLYSPYVIEGKQYPFEWEQDPENITHKFPPVVPSDEFLIGHPEINAFQVKYVIYMTNENFGLASMNNTCELDHFAARESYFWRKDERTYHRPANGKFVLDKTPIEMGTGYPVLHDPYYFGTLQVTITFIQDANNELTNEASVMFKFPFVIKSRPKKPIFYVIMTGIVMIVGALAVGAFLLYTKKKVVEVVKARNELSYTYKTAESSSNNRIDLG